jgi:rRNA maturation RNase YbeY
LQLAHRLDPDTIWQELQIHFVDDDGIRSAHTSYFNKDTVTDVISQRYAPMPGDIGATGEMIINTQQALRASSNRAWCWQKELALYVAHAIDHLHGSDDTSTTQRKQMRQRELRWLRICARKGIDYQALGSEAVKPAKVQRGK